MGFFPNIFKIPKSDIIPNIVTLGGYGLAKSTLVEGAKIVQSASRDVASRSIHHSQSGMQSPFNQYGQPGNQPQYQPSYGQQVYDNQLQYGSSPWDYSTTSAGYLDWTNQAPGISSRQASTFLDWGQGPFNL